MKIRYVKKNFKDATLATIHKANKIIEEYTSEGFDLTLRQLYYQFVSRDLIPNSQKEYKKLGDVINGGRLAGLISWNAIVDRTRNLETNPHWDDPRSFMESVMPQFAVDKWENQSNRVEVWIEKDALIGVVERVCAAFDVPYFSCRGYTSQSEMWVASQRLIGYRDESQTPIIIHLGDHDPSGKDMSRDIEDRLKLFCSDEIEVNRIALNMDQVRHYRPPPNPAKITDSRAVKYIKQFGRESWELDALDPKVLIGLISETISSYRDEEVWTNSVKRETKGRDALVKLTDKL